MRRLVIVAGVAQLVLCACAVPANETEQRAVLIEPSLETRAELQGAVDRALNGVSVLLAKGALTIDDQLIVERRPIRDASGRILLGREEDRPQHFHLVRIGERCVLVHDESGQRSELKTARCRALP